MNTTSINVVILILSNNFSKILMYSYICRLWYSMTAEYVRTKYVPLYEFVELYRQLYRNYSSRKYKIEQIKTRKLIEKYITYKCDNVRNLHGLEFFVIIAITFTSREVNDSLHFT